MEITKESLQAVPVSPVSPGFPGFPRFPRFPGFPGAQDHRVFLRDQGEYLQISRVLIASRLIAKAGKHAR